MLLYPQPTIMGTIERFNNGVHAGGVCPVNRNAYAAIRSVSRVSVLHKLNLTLFESSPDLESRSKKLSFMICDRLVYMLMRSLIENTLSGTYVLMVSSSTNITGTLKKIIQSIALLYTPIIVIKQDKEQFATEVFFSDYSSQITFESIYSLERFLLSTVDLNVSFVVVHPNLTKEYKVILNLMKFTKWYIPIDRGHIYISETKKNECTYSVYPWSSYPMCSGYISGVGTIRDTSTDEKNKYLGSFYFYENMISGGMINDLCVDCMCLKSISHSICSIIGEYVAEHTRSISSASIQALEEIKRRISEASSSSSS